jgi:protein SCO1/2
VPVRARLALLLVATFAVAAAFFITLGSDDDKPRAATRFEGSIRPPGIAPSDFTLRDQDGRTATLREYRGRPVVVTFLYTTCEDTCPLTAQQIRGALDELGHDVPVLVFAVDPPRDTPRRARAFLAEQRLTGRMRFLLGTRSQLAPQWKAYGIQPQSEELEHSAYVVVLDHTGRQRIGFPAGEVTPEALANDLRLLERAAGRRSP